MGFSEKQLKAIIALVDHGSIGRAAKFINMSQPALSRLIHSVEERHGVAIFQRLPTGVALTAAGEAFVPHARLLLFEMGQATDTLLAMRGLKRGVVRVGAVTAISCTILPMAVDRLLKLAPGIKVELLDQPDDRILAALVGNQIDLVISGRVVQDSEIFRMGECRYDDSYSIFCSIDHPLASKKQIDLDDVLNAPWIMPPPGATPRVLFEEIIKELGVPMPLIDIETASPSAIAAFVVNTKRLGWLPTSLFANEQETGRVVRLPVPEFNLSRHFYVYRRSKGLLPQPAQQFFRMLPLVDASPAALSE